MYNELTYELRNEIRNFVEGEFSETPSYLIEKAYSFSEGEIEQLTPYIPYEGDEVMNVQTCEEGTIVEIKEETVMVEVDGEEEEWDIDLIDGIDRFSGLPMWNILWRANNLFSYRFILDNLEAVAEAGFEIYQTEDDIYIGINGAGYDFYEAHWLPLYRAYRQR